MRVAPARNMHRLGAQIKRLCQGLACILFLVGCGQMHDRQPPGDVEREKEAAASANQGQTMAEQKSDLRQLFARRQDLCRMSADERRQWIENYRSASERQAEPRYTGPDRERQLSALMVASCEPARTPGLLRQMLSEVEARDWPMEYQALFEMLAANLRAYQLVDENRNLVQKELQDLLREHKKLQDDYKALELEHQKTIEGISDIERGIDSPTVDGLGL